MGLVLFVGSIIVGYILTEIIYWVIDKPIDRNKPNKEEILPSFKKVFFVVTLFLFIIFTLIFLTL